MLFFFSNFTTFCYSFEESWTKLKNWLFTCAGKLNNIDSIKATVIPGIYWLIDLESKVKRSKIWIEIRISKSLTSSQNKCHLNKADPVISAKLIVLYRFLSHNFPRSKTMWFQANSSIWHTKMLLILQITAATTYLNVFLSQCPSFSSCLEQRTVRNTRGPFLVLFSFMKEQVFVPKTPNIFAKKKVDWQIAVLQLFQAKFPPSTWVSFTKLKFRRSFWGAESVSYTHLTLPTKRIV